MKNFKKYLAESKKVYSFKVKVAGDVPENFHENLKKSLEKYQVVTLEKISTPVQESPMDFPELANKEVTIFDLVTEYPITAPEITNFVKEMGVREECFRVRGSSEPPEYEQFVDENGNVLLNDPFYSETTKIKHKDYFGEEFNKNFLKELAKVAKDRSKELGNDKKNPDVLGSSDKPKTDKAGAKSAIGS
jgi:predicted AAA+ superfamily ATPase